MFRIAVLPPVGVREVGSSYDEKNYAVLFVALGDA